MSNKRRHKSLILTAVLLLLLAGISFYYFRIPNEDIVVRIPEKSSTEEIANILLRNKIISSKKLFKIMSYLTRSSMSLHSGTYSFNRRSNVLQVLYKLRKAKVLLIRLTIPEGYRCDQIAELLEQKNIADRKKFLEIVNRNKLEGYLFPDTYFFSEGTAEQTVVDRMNGEFNKKYTPEFDARASALKMTKHMAVTLASIIEKEAKLEKEKTLISSVFHNRLKKHWLLESCATVRFAKKKYTGKLYYKDLNVKSPYNTYRTYGLPPGPICNPGLFSVRAALYPADSNLLFFFSSNNNEGTHEFSIYYKQHIKGQQKNKKL